MSGRPLRFLGCALVGWVAVRTAMLWPALDTPAALPRLLIPSAEAETDTAPVAQTEWVPGVRVTRKSERPRPGILRAPQFEAAVVPPTRLGPIAFVGSTAAVSTPPSPTAEPVIPFAAPLPGRLPAPSRWSGSAWLVLRDGGLSNASFGNGQLGGSQAGVRIAYAIDRARRLALVARLAGPLRGTGREASVGVEWHPTKLPLRFLSEHRFAIDGGRGGPAAGVIAGTGPAPIALGFDLETYGQAGVIRRDRAEPFAEGAARLSRPVARTGKFKLDLGIGSWGGAQHDAQRLDIGPTLGLTLPIGGRTLRASGDWRQRIAGRASPGSGPTLTIGVDF